MNKYLITLISFVIYAGTAFSQAKQKPVIKIADTELKKVLTGSGLPFTIVNDSLAVIPYGGANIESFQVVIQKISELYIIYVNLSEALPGKIDESKYKYLLQRNDHFDIIKIGLGEGDNKIYVRADIYKT